MRFSSQVKLVTSFDEKKRKRSEAILSLFFFGREGFIFFPRLINFPCSTGTGDQMVFFLLNAVELVGLLLTFKPFLAVPEQYDTR
jgi:hypothetical protein